MHCFYFNKFLNVNKAACLFKFEYDADLTKAWSSFLFANCSPVTFEFTFCTYLNPF